jgi:hypothetical protein
VFFLFRRSADQSCNMLIGKIRDMQDNLARLDNLRRTGGDDSSYRIRELQGMMNARGCDLPGGGMFESDAPNQTFEDDAPYYQGGGTYRTLCVRTCDGYYFPISFSTTSENFTHDSQICQAMCPGARAELYYHNNPGGGPETMTSITGAPYTALATAFQYRTSLNPACTCKPAGGYTVASLATGEQQPVYADDPTAPLPRPRPGRGEDPETLADRAGYFVPRPVVEEPASGTPVAAGPDGHSIRVVGPLLGNAAQDALVIAPVPN